MRPLMSHGREMYTLLLEPLLKEGGSETWSGILTAALAMVERGDIRKPVDRGRLASNIIMIADRKEMSVVGLYEHLSCLSLLINDVPTEFLLDKEKENLRSNSSMMDISDTDEEEDNDLVVLQGSSSSGWGGGGGRAAEDIPSFAPLQAHQDDPHGAGSRLLRGIDMTEPLKKGTETKERRRRFGLSSSSSTSPPPSGISTTGCEGCRLLLSTAHAVRLFDAVLPSNNNNNNKDGDEKSEKSEKNENSEENPTRETIKTTVSLCSLYDQIFERLHVVRSKQRELIPPPGAGLTMLSALSFHSSLVRRMWYGLKSSLLQWMRNGCDGLSDENETHPTSTKKQKTAAITTTTNVTSASSSSSSFFSFSSASNPVSINMSPSFERAFCLFCTCYSHLLLSLTDLDVYTQGVPFPLTEQVELVQCLSMLLKQMCWDEEILHMQPPMYPTRRLRLMLSATKLFNQLYARNCRKEFCNPELFLFQNLPLTEFTASAVGAGGQRNAQMAFRAVLLLSRLPQTVPFSVRVTIYEQLLANDRQNGGVNHHGHGHNVRIRRTRAVADAMDGLPNDGPSLKHRVQITFVDEHGNEEDGIDGGGLFKEFIDVVSKQAFR